MKLRDVIQTYLTVNDLKPSALARAAGINPSVLSRYLSGRQASMLTATLDKLTPFVYGGELPPVAGHDPQERARGTAAANRIT
ncbi:MAG: helix-turn-helix domain-containing protein [Desulfovibrionaceae bacterium]